MPVRYVPLFRYFTGLSANGLDSSEYFHLSSVVTLGGLQLASLCLPIPQDARRSKTGTNDQSEREVQGTNDQSERDQITETTNHA